MTTLQEFGQQVLRFVEGRCKRWQLEREFAQLEAMGSLDSTLTDIGLTRSQIESLLAGYADSPDLLGRMLARLGIDPARLPAQSLRTMTWACTTCADKRQCRTWLDEGGDKDFHEFCPNAAQLDEAMPSSPEAPLAAGVQKGGTYYPSADEFKRMRAETRQREVTALLGAAP